MKYAVGVDIGGTKTVVALSEVNAKVVAKQSFPTDASQGAEQLVQRIRERYISLCEQSGISKEQVSFAGVACPGPLDIKTGKIVHIATMGFRNVPIKAMLEQALELPVFLENDANCAAFAESVIGAGTGLDPVVYVTISTGIGCGIVADRKIVSGACSSAGEIGHLTVEPNGRECPCGKKGCLELYASGTAIAKDGSALRKTPLSTKQVFDLAREGDADMQRIIADSMDRLGLALSAVYHLIDPAVVVLGGSVTKDYAFFTDMLKNALQKYTQPLKGRELDIRISRFDGEQVVIGALLYGEQAFLQIKR